MADLQNSDIPSENGYINKGVSLNTYLTYSFINNSTFYPLVPTQFRDYYNRMVRRYFYWYDGFDPLFHTQQSGIFSTRLAYTVCNKLAQVTVGNDIMYDVQKQSTKRLNGLTALEKVEKWTAEVDLPAKLKTLTSYGYAGGDSIIKLNGSKKTPHPTILRKDNYFYTADFSNKIIDFTGLIYSFTDTKGNKEKENSQESSYYYLLEERKFDNNNKPVYRVFAKVGKGNITSAKNIDLRTTQEIPYDKLPRKFKSSLKDEFPGIKLGQWNKLPFKNSLGLYLFKNTDSVSFIPQINMGESLLSNIISYLMSYDFYYSALNTDLYNARGRVLLPRSMQNPDNKGFSSHYSEMSDGYYSMIDYLDPKEQTPQAIQFDLRGNDWTTISKILLRGIAMSIGVSERTIAASLTEGVEKSTAREISVDDATSTFVTEKRTNLRKPINEMINDILEFYSFDDEITVRFSRVGLTNMNEVVKQMTVLKQNNLVDIKTALEYIFVDKNDKQLEKMKKQIIEEREITMNLENVKKDEEGTSDEGFEQDNNDDIEHIKKE